MEYLAVLVAAIAAYAFGSVWYMALAEPWMQAAGIKKGANGRPDNGAGAMVYITAFIATLVVAGMMRHIFTLAGIDGAGKGLVSGLGLGLLSCFRGFPRITGFPAAPATFC